MHWLSNIPPWKAWLYGRELYITKVGRKVRDVNEKSFCAEALAGWLASWSSMEKDFIYVYNVVVSCRFIYGSIIGL